jgi:hypothetical protein
LVWDPPSDEIRRGTHFDEISFRRIFLDDTLCTTTEFTAFTPALLLAAYVEHFLQSFQKH